jgi:hypothetical protein
LYLHFAGNDLLLSSEGASVQELARKFTHLNAKWSDVTDGIYEKFKTLKEASHDYGEFRGEYKTHDCGVPGMRYGELPAQLRLYEP